MWEMFDTWIVSRAFMLLEVTWSSRLCCVAKRLRIFIEETMLMLLCCPFAVHSQRVQRNTANGGPFNWTMWVFKRKIYKITLICIFSILFCVLLGGLLSQSIQIYYKTMSVQVGKVDNGREEKEEKRNIKVQDWTPSWYVNWIRFPLLLKMGFRGANYITYRRPVIKMFDVFMPKCWNFKVITILLQGSQLINKQHMPLSSKFEFICASYIQFIVFFWKMGSCKTRGGGGVL